MNSTADRPALRSGALHASSPPALIPAVLEYVYSGVHSCTLVPVPYLGASVPRQPPGRQPPGRQDEADHCETPVVAYRDAAPLLRLLARSLDKSPAKLRIYDPFYCAGMRSDRQPP